MFGWLRRRRLSNQGRRRLILALARAEESLIEAHVTNALDVIGAVADELPLERALEVYLKALAPGEPRAEIVARRVLARLEANASPEARARSPLRLRRILSE